MTDQNPFCAKAPEGFHCGHEIHRHQTFGAITTRLTAKCCWCDALEEMTFSRVKIAIAGHGMGLSQEVEIWDLPVEWHKGDA